MQSRPLFALSLLALLAACASKPERPSPVSSNGVKIGRPYEVFGKTYTPRDDRSYDERGIASRYGPTFHAKPTATGEIYNQDDVTAAHKTLPMPSWVEVTNLDNGRTLTVRINDRGPFVDGCIIDLSRRSAQLLGVDGPGLAKVRVKRVFPKGDWAKGDWAATIALPPLPSMEVPAVAALSPQPSPSSAKRYIQVVALSEESRAQAVASVLSDFGPARATQTQSGLWRVRIGPLSPENAEDLLPEIRAAGYPDARVSP